MIRVVIADDNQVLRMGLVSHLALCEDMEVVGEAADGRAALEEVRRHEPDVLILDVRMPELDGLAVLEQLDGDVKVLMLTNSEDPAVIQGALRRGASGYLVYPHAEVSEIDEAVRKVARGNLVLGSQAAQHLVSVMPVDEDDGPLSSAQRALVRKYDLSDREVEVLDLVARGQSNSEIGKALFISDKTVKNHLYRISTKLGASSRIEVMGIWRGDREALL